MQELQKYSRPRTADWVGGVSSELLQGGEFFLSHQRGDYGGALRLQGDCSGWCFLRRPQVERGCFLRASASERGAGRKKNWLAVVCQTFFARLYDLTGRPSRVLEKSSFSPYGLQAFAVWSAAESRPNRSVLVRQIACDLGTGRQTFVVLFSMPVAVRKNEF